MQRDQARIASVAIRMVKAAVIIGSGVGGFGGVHAGVGDGALEVQDGGPESVGATVIESGTSAAFGTLAPVAAQGEDGGRIGVSIPAVLGDGAQAAKVE
jgi:hypothetical protein